MRMNFSVLLFLSMSYFHFGMSYKILMLPLSFGFNSRMLNIQRMADILEDAGHDVTVLLNSKLEKYAISKKANVLIKNIPPEVNLTLTTDFDVVKDGQMDIWKVQEFLKIWTDMSYGFCDEMLKDKSFWESLKFQKFDLIFMDAIEDCDLILIDMFDNPPSIMYNNNGFAPNIYFNYPLINSICCSVFGQNCNSDDMSFFERTTNLLFLGLINFVIAPSTYERFRNLKKLHGINSVVDVSDVFQNSIVLLNTEFVLDFPRPVMPNVFTISGLLHEEPNHLPSNFQTFISQSEPHGIIVLSFGTLMPTIDKTRAEILARVFGRLPQRVIWRHEGEAPKNLQNNTMITKWFPQRDVLAHPLTRLFITHCGVSSMYEAAYNAVPIIATPLFVDQYYHASRLVNRAKMGVQLNFDDYNEAALFEAINEVLTNPIYQINAKKTSAMLQDQVVSPKQQFTHLIEYVIRHNGAKHLISKPAIRMNLLQFYSVDVIGFLILVTLVFTYIVFRLILCVVKCMKRLVAKKKKD